MRVCANCNNPFILGQTRVVRPDTGKVYHQFVSDCMTKTVPGDMLRRLRKTYKLSAADLAQRIGKQRFEIYQMEKKPMSEAVFKDIEAKVGPIKKFGSPSPTVTPLGKGRKLTPAQKSTRTAQGKEIKHLRTEKGIFRTVLAAKLGIHEDRLESYERGMASMTPEMYQQVKDTIYKMKKRKKPVVRKPKKKPPETVTILKSEFEKIKDAADKFLQLQGILGVAL